MTLGIISLAVIAALALLYQRIAEHLKDNHTNVWVGLGMPSGAQPDTSEVTPVFLAEQSLAAYLLKGNVSTLNDARLNGLVLVWRLLGVAAILLVILSIFSGFST